MRILDPAPHGWKIKDDGYYELNCQGTIITLEPRPPYCDRGNWIAKITNAGRLWIDGSDGWPRYYFDLAAAFSEIEAFLCRRSNELETPPESPL